jgi:hypothetical protein
MTRLVQWGTILDGLQRFRGKIEFVLGCLPFTAGFIPAPLSDEKAILRFLLFIPCTGAFPRSAQRQPIDVVVGQLSTARLWAMLIAYVGP